jgi:hypothetical protein
MMTLAPLKDDEVRELMKQEAIAHDARLDPRQLAELQQKAGNNPALAKRIVRETVLGISELETSQHYQFIDGTPFLVALLMLVGIVRFLGLGLGDKALYVLGGMLTILVLILRAVLYAANRGSRRL